jgi:hypothetical protein
MVWRGDTLDWHGRTFLLENPAAPRPGVDGLILWKTPALIEQYRTFWARHTDFPAAQIVELGLWKGGSVVFWLEALQPTRLLAVDQRPESGSPVFDTWAAANRDRVTVAWGVDQADAARLVVLVGSALTGPLDLVIDDASHRYEPTLASFEALFPLLRPGGFYIVEDWAWAHWPTLHAAFAGLIPLTRLVTECIEATGNEHSGVAGVTVAQGFAAIERGSGSLPSGWRLSDAIIRPPAAPVSLRALLRSVGREVWRRMGVRGPAAREE